MRWKFSILVLVITTLACNLGAPSQIVQEAVPSPTLDTSPVTETPTPYIVPVQPTPLPTDTFTPFPLPAGNNPLVGENRIQFAHGGTWAEVGTHLEENKEIRYVLSAMKGQVMGVSVRQSWPFTIEVLSASGSLTDPGVEHPFWHGTLPTTGDYTIIVKTYVTGDFTLRVSINLPGQTYQYFDYESPQQTATLRYSDEFAPTTYLPAGDFKGSPSLVLQYSSRIGISSIRWTMA